MSDVTREIKELYSDYLNEKLDLIFNGVDGRVVPFVHSVGDNLVPDDNGWKIIKRDDVAYYNEGQYNFVNKYDQTISEEWFREVDNFYNGFARVKRVSGSWNYLKPNGEFLIKDDSNIKYADDFHNLVARVNNGKWYFMDNQGKFLFDADTIAVGDFHNGMALALIEYWAYNGTPGQESHFPDRDTYNFVDTSGNMVSRVNFKQAYEFNNGYAVVKKDNGKPMLIDTNCQEINHKQVKNMFVNLSFIVINDKVKLRRKIAMGDYKVRRTLGGYLCISKTGSYITKYKPIKRYGLVYTLCIHEDQVYLHSSLEKEPELLGNARDIEYDDNFIYDIKHNKIYLIYEGKKIELTETDYYQKHLMGKREITISHGIKEIATLWTFAEFTFMSRDDIQRKIQEEKETNKRIRTEQARVKKHEELEIIDAERKQQELSFREREKEILSRVLKDLNDYRELHKNGKKPGDLIDIQDLLFVPKDDHLVINELFKGFLSILDLSSVSFANVDVHGVDFSKTNVTLSRSNLNPQTVYNKDLRGCDFCNIHINPYLDGWKYMCDFTGVHIEGAKFTNTKTFAILHPTFKNAFYDDETLYNKEPLVAVIKADEEKKKNKTKNHKHG